MVGRGKKEGVMCCLGNKCVASATCKARVALFVIYVDHWESRESNRPLHQTQTRARRYFLRVGQKCYCYPAEDSWGRHMR